MGKERKKKKKNADELNSTVQEGLEIFVSIIYHRVNSSFLNITYSKMYV